MLYIRSTLMSELVHRSSYANHRQTSLRFSSVLVTFSVDCLSLSVFSEISFNFPHPLAFASCFVDSFQGYHRDYFPIEGFDLHNSWHKICIHMHTYDLHMFTMFLSCKLTLKMFTEL